jgi:UDP-glucose 4-epimerase
VVPTILGFDPRYQFVHEDDVVSALAHASRNDLPGVYNVAADGVLALTEVIDLLGKQWAPLLPPWGTGLAAAAMRRLGLRIPPEMLGQLRFGRGLDNRKLKASGFGYRYTSRETVIALAEYMRLHPVMRGAQEPYRYEREVEDFLRWSPHVKNPAFRKGTDLTPEETTALSRLHAAYEERVGAPSRGSPGEQADALGRAARTPATEAAGEAPDQNGQEPPFDDLEPEEIVSLLDSLESPDLLALRDHERGQRARPRVLSAIDAALARRETAQTRN